MTATATPRHDSDSRRDTRARAVAAWALLVFTLLVAGATFALTFHGLDGYGRIVMKLGGLSWLVPVCVDGATLVAIASSFVMANAQFRVRLYAWLVFAFCNVASVAGNLAFGQSQHLPWQGMLGAAAWPLILTLVAHLAVVTWRHRDTTPRGAWTLDRARAAVAERQLVAEAIKAGAVVAIRPPAQPATTEPAATPTPPPAPPEPRPATPVPGTASPAPLAGPTTTRRAKRDTKKAPTPTRGRRGGDIGDQARELWAPGKSAAAILLQMGLPATDANRRKVERATKPLRDKSGGGARVDVAN